MSVPKSTVLSCSRSFLNRTDVGYNNASQNVSVVVSPTMCHYDSPPKEIKTNVNPYTDCVENEVKERSIDTANDTLTNMQNIIQNKDYLIQALVLCLDILQNNPLIINKYVIAEENELALLIKYLTSADEVNILKDDHECKGCLGKGDKFDIVNRIMVKKDGELYNLKYSFPDVIQFLFERRFSTKFVIPTKIK